MDQRQQGKVLMVKSDGTANIQIRRRGACSSDGKCSHGQLFTDVNQQLTIDAQNTVGAQVGDWVDVAYDASLALRAAFAIYILPILSGLLIYGGLTSLVSASSYWLPIAAVVGTVGTFAWSFNHFSRRKFSYSVVALVDEKALPVAPACQGCSLANADKVVDNLRDGLAREQRQFRSK